MESDDFFEQPHSQSPFRNNTQIPRSESSGTLKLFIKKSQNAHVVHNTPFCLLNDLPGMAKVSGYNNLMAHFELEHTYAKYSGKKVKEPLSSFLPNLPGDIDKPGTEDSTLMSVIEKPPIGGKEIVLLSTSALAGFRLHAGSLPDQMMKFRNPQQKKKKKKHKREAESTAGDRSPATSRPPKESNREREDKKDRKKEKKRDKKKDKKKNKGERAD